MFKDYNMNQLILPLDLEMKLQENDIAFSIYDKLLEDKIIPEIKRENDEQLSIDE